MSDYREQLKHPKWQRVRLERLEAAGWKCELCGDTEKMLHVHHKQYVRGRMPWEYGPDELEVLCEDCHAKEHGIAPRPARRSVRQAVRQPIDRVLWMLLLESRWWHEIDHRGRELLFAMPGWQGEAVRFLARSIAERGAEPWRIVRERICTEDWGEKALALVDGEDPAIKPLLNDMRSAVWHVSQAKDAPMYARILRRP